MFDWTTVGGCEWVGLPCEVKTRGYESSFYTTFLTRGARRMVLRGGDLPSAQFPAAEGSDRLHIARPKIRTREIRVSENSESNKEICEKRKSGEGWDFLSRFPCCISFIFVALIFVLKY